MADNQRIHPVQDLERQQVNPTVPLVPRGTSKSDKPEEYPAPGGTTPVRQSRPPKRRSCWCRCLCWTFGLLLLLILILGLVVLALYLIFQPKIPKFSIDSMRITQFNLANDLSTLSATFNVTIIARNPNEKIGIYYEDGSHISAWYTDTKLSEGSMPVFYQGHENTTILSLDMTGETRNASSLFQTLQQQQQQTGNIPLNLRVRQPVRIKLGKLKLPEVKFKVRCRLLVDNLSSNNVIRIQDSSCKFRFRL